MYNLPPGIPIDYLVNKYPCKKKIYHMVSTIVLLVIILRIMFFFFYINKNLCKIMNPFFINNYSKRGVPEFLEATCNRGYVTHFPEALQQPQVMAVTLC